MPDFKLDRLQAARWASEVIASSDNWLILDTETTGLRGDDEIVQIAAIQGDGEVLLNSLVKPTCEIGVEAVAIHGIQPHHVVDAPTFDQVFLQLLKVTGRRKLAIYNKEFDIRMIQQSLRPYNICLSVPFEYWINGSSLQCVMHQYAQWVGDWSDYHHSYRWQRLPGGDHSALGDCIATLNMIKRMAASYEELLLAEQKREQMPEFKTWANLKPDTPFNHLFPDGRVPIRSPLPIIPREEGSPLCYIVPGSLLTEEQLRGLAEMLWQQWQPECQSLEQAIEYIRGDALPLRVDWFSSFTSSDPGIFFTLIDNAGDDEDEKDYLDSQEDWDDSDLDEEDDRP